MANETTVQTSCIQENPEVDECRENIPPTAAGGPKLKVQVGEVIGYSSAQPSGENEPLSDTCTFSTPAPANSNGGVKAKSRISGLQSALTPILKYLNIGNKSKSPDPLKGGRNPRLSVPFDVNTANCQKSPGGSNQHPNSDFSSSHSGRSLGDKDAPVCWLHDEYLPEITLLDVTCDSTMQMTRNDSALPDSAPATPVTSRSVNSTFSALQPSQSSSSAGISITVHKTCPQNKTVDPLQYNLNSPKAESQTTGQASLVSKNTTDTSLDMNQNSSAVQDASFVQKPNSKQNDTITLSETSSNDSHQNTMNKPSPLKVCNPPTSPKDGTFEVHLHELSKQNWTTTSKDYNAKMVDPPESTAAPLRWLDDRYFPEITLLDVTRDSELSPGVEISPMELTQDFPPVDSKKNSRPSSELSVQSVSESGSLNTIQSEELSSTLTGSVTHTKSSFSEQSDKCEEENVKVSLEVTRDISMGSDSENSTSSSSEPSEQNVVKSQTLAEDALGSHLANVTRDISSSSDMSVQSASDMQCNTSLKNVTSELHVNPAETSNTVEANSEELLTSHDAELTSRVPQPSPETTGSANSTFTIVQPANLSASTDLNATAQTSCPQNKTLDLPPSNENNPKAESEVSADLKNTTSLSMSHDCSSVKASSPCEVQNATFDRHSLQKASTSAKLGEACATTFCLQNTFDSKPPSKQNGTITLSEISSSDDHQNTLDKPSPSKVCNPPMSPKDSNSEGHTTGLSKQNETTTSTDPDAKVVDTHEGTFEANPAVEVASGTSRCETKDNSQSRQPGTDGLSDPLVHQGMDVENNKANTFNLDDTLDLRVDALVTSTPMTNCKAFHFTTEREEGKTIGAQKKLYRDGPGKPVGQVPPDAATNIVSDRKTFLTQPAAKSLLPPSKVASQLLKYKPASLLPGRFEPLTSGLPMTRQRTQTEALKNAAASDAAQGTTGISSSYNLRPLTIGCKQPNSGLPRPQLSGIPSGIQRPAPGLRPPSARSNAPAPTSTDKLRGPTATNPVTKTSQSKKHPLTKGEALPTAKRKKIDAPLPSRSAEALTSSCESVNRAKTLKHPTTNQRALPAKSQRDDAAAPASAAETSAPCDAASRARALKLPASSHRALLAKPQGHGCAKCVALEEELKIKSEEIRRLKEELLKYSKQEDC